MRILLYIALAALLASCTGMPALANPADVMESLMYVREETNHNDHPMIDRILAHVGLPPRLAWCQATAAFCVDTDAGRRVMPRTGSVHQGVKWALRNRLTVATLTPQQVLLGAKVPRGAVVAFKHGMGADAETFSGNGHAGVTLAVWSGASGRTGEGNTKSGPGGDQRGASTSMAGGRDGVFPRTRGLGLAGNFPVVLFYWPRGLL